MHFQSDCLPYCWPTLSNHELGTCFGLVLDAVVVEHQEPLCNLIVSYHGAPQSIELWCTFSTSIGASFIPRRPSRRTVGLLNVVKTYELDYTTASCLLLASVIQPGMKENVLSSIASDGSKSSAYEPSFR